MLLGPEGGGERLEQRSSLRTSREQEQPAHVSETKQRTSEEPEQRQETPAAHQDVSLIFIPTELPISDIEAFFIPSQEFSGNRIRNQNSSSGLLHLLPPSVLQPHLLPHAIRPGSNHVSHPSIWWVGSRWRTTFQRVEVSFRRLGGQRSNSGTFLWKCGLFCHVQMFPFLLFIHHQGNATNSHVWCDHKTLIYKIYFT